MNFRDYHFDQILRQFEVRSLPLDVFLSGYFRHHKAIGSKDRKFLSETVYERIRWKGLFQYLYKHRLDSSQFMYRDDDINPLDFLDKKEIPPHIRLSFPKRYYEALFQAYGREKSWEICLLCNTRAPTTLRVNPLKTSREALLSRWKDRYKISPCHRSPYGVVFSEKINFFSLLEFKKGLFEIQDEASQLIAFLVEAKPKEHILDYCAGAGGKTLAFAPSMQNKGQIYLHDIRSSALKEARKRLNRAGIQNIQFGISPALKKKMDWVLVDVPCSGSGTLRRNPDMKWKFSFDNLPNLVEEQKQIFASALEYLKPKGKIVYATCSIFPEENQEQAAYFQKTYDLKSINQFQSLPEKNGMDGFYGIVLQKL